MRPTNPLSIIHDKHKGKTSVVKSSGGITKQKGKASVVKPKATIKETALVASSSGTRKKANKGKGKTNVVKPKGGIAKKKGKAPVKEDKGKGKCFHCQGEGHWKRNYPKYLESLETKGKGKDGEGMTFSSLFTSKCSKSSSNAWLLDTGTSSHICSSLQDLANERRLDRKSTRLNSSHSGESRMPSSA